LVATGVIRPTGEVTEEEVKKPLVIAPCPQKSSDVDYAYRYQLIDRQSFHFCEQHETKEKTFGERLREFMSDSQNNEEFRKNLDVL
jgi:hypothetical protein